MKNNKFIQRVLGKYPRLPFFMTISYVLFTIVVVVLVVYIPDVGERLPRLHEIISFILLSGPLVLTVLHLNNIKKSLSSIRHLAILYIEIILMFGIIYFYLVSTPHASGVDAGKIEISGVDAQWVENLKGKKYQDQKYQLLLSALKCMQDCLHFSLITSTTVGYGDMVPKGVLPKLIVDIQVLICLFLISFGAGTVFSNTQKKNLKHDDKIDYEKIKELEERVISLEKIENDKGKSVNH